MVRPFSSSSIHFGAKLIWENMYGNTIPTKFSGQNFNKLGGSMRYRHSDPENAIFLGNWAEILKSAE
jgi:hypothetical protein